MEDLTCELHELNSVKPLEDQVSVEEVVWRSQTQILYVWSRIYAFGV